jgi:hypothetical protein
MYPLDKKGKIANETAGYQKFETLSGEDAGGEAVVALLGVKGASRHILSRSYERITPRHRDIGYHSFEIRDGELFGQVGSIEHPLGSWPPEAIDE